MLFDMNARLLSDFISPGWNTIPFYLSFVIIGERARTKKEEGRIQGMRGLRGGEDFKRWYRDFTLLRCSNFLGKNSPSTFQSRSHYRWRYSSHLICPSENPNSNGNCHIYIQIILVLSEKISPNPRPSSPKWRQSWIHRMDRYQFSSLI